MGSSRENLILQHGLVLVFHTLGILNMTSAIDAISMTNQHSVLIPFLARVVFSNLSHLVYMRVLIDNGFHVDKAGISSPIILNGNHSS